MKISVSSYSYQKLINAGSYTLFDVVDQSARFGFAGVEFIDGHFPSDKKEALALAKKLRTVCGDAGLCIPSFTVGGNLLPNPELDNTLEVERLKGMIDVAAELGAPLLRHDAAWGFPAGYEWVRAFESVLPIMVEACIKITEYAKSAGVGTMTENHGTFSQESDRLSALVALVGNPNFGILCDIGNFTCADEDPRVAVGRVAPMTKHVHAKDMHMKSGQMPDPGRGYFRSRGGNYLRGAIIGHGDVPILPCLRALTAAGYDGQVSVEFEGMEDALTGIEVGHENLKRYVAMV